MPTYNLTRFEFVRRIALPNGVPGYIIRIKGEETAEVLAVCHLVKAEGDTLVPIVGKVYMTFQDGGGFHSDDLEEMLSQEDLPEMPLEYIYQAILLLIIHNDLSYGKVGTTIGQSSADHVPT